MKTNKLVISPAEAGAAWWTVDISLNDEVILTRVPLNLPITNTEENEIVWYLEKYPQSPFDADRAINCICLLQRYSDALFEQLELATVGPRIKLAEAEGREAETLLVEISEYLSNEVGASSIHRIYWELLEEERLWLGMVGAVVVRRRFTSYRISKHIEEITNLLNREKLVPWRPPVTSAKPPSYNVLLVVARNLDTDSPEVDPVVGPAPLAALFREMGQSSGSRFALEVVRPGTYAAFRKHLQISTERHGQGYFHLVHFDMHGVVAKRPTRGTAEEPNPAAIAGLLFASKTHGGKLDFVPARRIAKVVQEHGIRLVVSNSCRSASAGVHDVEANLAAVMLEEGITNVLAMQTEFMSGAAKLFIVQFYRSFLQHRVSFSRAVRDARKYLQSNPTRRARFGLEVDLQDWIVPVAYLTDIDLEITTPEVQIHPHNPPPLAPDHATKPNADFEGPELVGRDRDALRIERDLTESQVLILYGQAGVGKTALLRQLVNVWRATNFVEQVLYVDFAQNPTPVTMQRLVDRINGNDGPETGLIQKMGETVLGWCGKEKPKLPRDIAAEVKQLVQRCYDHSTVLVLDSLDAALSILPQFSVFGSLPEETRIELYLFINDLIESTPAKGQKKPLLVLTGRGHETWWNGRFQQVPARFINLKPLDLPSAVILGTRILQQAGVDTSIWDVNETNVLHQLVNLFGRLPLVLELILPNAQSVSLAKFYGSMHLQMVPFHDVLWRHKSSTPGSDRILHDLRRQFADASFQMRNVLRSLAFFWLEGPAFRGLFLAWIELDPGMTMIPDFIKTFASFRDIGGWEVNDNANCITDVHPLMTIFLRSKLRSYIPFESRIRDDQLLRAFRIMIDGTQKELTMLYVTGKYDLALICRIRKRSLVNIVALMQHCINDGASLKAQDWPRDSLVWFCNDSRYAFRDSVPDHQYLLSYLEPTLERYVATFGGPRKSLSPVDLPFALQMSNHLAFMYLGDLKLCLSEQATRYVNYSIELIRASEREHPPMLNPGHISAKVYAFRCKAFICLFQRDFDGAQAYWNKQTLLEIITLEAVRSIGEQQSGPSEFFGERIEVGDALKEVYKNYIPAMAKMRESAWAHMVKAIKEQDISTVEDEIRPYAREFMEQVFGSPTPAMTRVLDISKETAFDVGYLLEEHDYSSVDHLTQQLETGLNRADARSIVLAECNLLEQALVQENWASAQVHIGLLLRHLPSLPGVSPILLEGLSMFEADLRGGREQARRRKFIDIIPILMAVCELVNLVNS